MGDVGRAADRGQRSRNINDETREILTNKEIIAVDQDKLGRQGFRISKENGFEVWVKPLENGDLAVAMLNRTDVMTSGTAHWELLDLKGKHKVRDLWLHLDMGSPRDFYSAEVQSHGVVMLRIAR